LPSNIHPPSSVITRGHSRKIDQRTFTAQLLLFSLHLLDSFHQYRFGGLITNQPISTSTQFMQRRVALKNLALVAGSLISLPSWANGWSKNSVESPHPYLTTSQDELLAEVVETIIPATNTPGAKELGVHTFLQKMVADCFEKSAKDTLAKGLDTVEATAKQRFTKSFAACDATQRTEILQAMERSTDAGQKGFFGLVKGLTIRGYMSSEYVMTNITKFEFVPGRYHGCVPVASK
jgi:hypothetical protein